MDLVVQSDQDTLTTRRRRDGDPSRVEEVPGTVGIRSPRGALRGSEDHGAVRIDQHVEKECGLFQGVGSVGHDDPRQARVAFEQLSDSARQPELDLGRHARAADRHEVLDTQGRHAWQIGNQLEQILGFQRSGRPPGDGPARGQKMHSGWLGGFADRRREGQGRRSHDRDDACHCLHRAHLAARSGRRVVPALMVLSYGTRSRNVTCSRPLSTSRCEWRTDADHRGREGCRLVPVPRSRSC